MFRSLVSSLLVAFGFIVLLLPPSFAALFVSAFNDTGDRIDSWPAFLATCFPVGGVAFLALLFYYIQFRLHIRRLALVGLFIPISLLIIGFLFFIYALAFDDPRINTFNPLN